MRINVAYACNDAYIMQTGISMISLFENNKNVDEIYIYFIDMGTTEQSRKALSDICDKYRRNIIVISFTEWENDLKIASTGRHIASVYAKIFFGRICDIDRIIYIDSDTVILDSLVPMWETELGDCWIAGVETLSSANHNMEIGISPEDIFINDGMVLMDLVAWRNNDAESKCFDYIEMHNGNPPVLSEGTINYVCKDHVLRIDPRFNLLSGLFYYSTYEIKHMTNRDYYSESIISAAKNNPVIIHYLAGFYNRPWNVKCTHPKKDSFLYYKQISIWKEEPLQKKEIDIKLKLINLFHKILPKVVFISIYRILSKE